MSNFENLKEAVRSPSAEQLTATTSSASLLGEVEHFGKLFGEGVITGAVLNPINAIADAGDALSGGKLHLPPLEFSNQQEVNNSPAGLVGEITGLIGGLALTSGATSALALDSTFGLIFQSAYAQISGLGAVENVLDWHLRDI